MKERSCTRNGAFRDVRMSKVMRSVPLPSPFIMSSPNAGSSAWSSTAEEVRVRPNGVHRRNTLRRLTAALLLLASASAHGEVCRFAGTTSRGGQVAVKTEIGARGEEVTADVTVSFKVQAWFSEITYLGQEISTWRGGALQSLATNTRTVVDGAARRQQWDLFVHHGPGLHAYRVQAKRLADFQQRHPGFVRHWDPASFGQPWLQDYPAASPERRPDLDLPRSAPGLRSPLALAFFWSRFLAPGGGEAPVFLPGFKRNALTEVAWGASAQGEGWRRWQSRLQHPGLDRSPPSVAAVWVSPDGYLLQLGAEVHAALGSGKTLLRAEGCQGVRIVPEGGTAH